jgi:hypothetical protein
MPQFDTFSFLSQLLWVFSLFSLLYMTLSYYVLPAIAITLKVRKKQLSLSTSSASSNVVNNTDVVSLIGLGFDNLMTKDKSAENLVTTSKDFDKLTINSLNFKNFSTNLSVKLSSLVLQG